MKKRKVIILLLLVIGIAGSCLGWKIWGLFRIRGNIGISSNGDFLYVNKVSDIVNFVGSGYTERYGGVIEPQATVKIKLESEKKVKECKVKEGEHVEEGQILFTYDTTEDENKLAQLEIDIERAQGEIETTKATIERLEKEKKKANQDDQLAYTTDILTQQSSIKMSEYDIKTKTLEMEQLKTTIQNSEVKSEVSGRIQKINPPDNDGMGLSESTYMTILQDGDFQIKCNLNEQNLSSVTEGMEMIIFSRLDSEKKWGGTVKEVVTDNITQESSSDQFIDVGNASGSSNYCFYVTADSTDGMLLGQHVYLEENRGQGEKKEGLWLDQSWIVLEQEAYVWKSDESNTIKKQKIRLGEYDEENQKYRILSGLTESDCIAYPMDTIQEGTLTIMNEYDGSIPEMGIEEIVNDEELSNDSGQMENSDISEDEVLYPVEPEKDGASNSKEPFEDEILYSLEEPEQNEKEDVMPNDIDNKEVEVIDE